MQIALMKMAKSVNTYKKAIESILSFHKFEGFYCSEKTEVYWGVYVE